MLDVEPDEQPGHAPGCFLSGPYSPNRTVDSERSLVQLNPLWCCPANCLRNQSESMAFSE
jgi:hypothetical protein